MRFGLAVFALLSQKREPFFYFDTYRSICVVLYLLLKPSPTVCVVSLACFRERTHTVKLQGLCEKDTACRSLSSQQVSLLIAVVLREAGGGRRHYRRSLLCAGQPLLPVVQLLLKTRRSLWVCGRISTPALIK